MNTKQRQKIRTELKMKKCKYCHSVENLTVDHKIPVSKGGKYEIKNLQCLCRDCNQTKSSLTDGDVKNLFKWFIRIQEQRLRNGSKPILKEYVRKLYE